MSSNRLSDIEIGFNAQRVGGNGCATGLGAHQQYTVWPFGKTAYKCKDRLARGRLSTEAGPGSIAPLPDSPESNKQAGTVETVSGRWPDA